MTCARRLNTSEAEPGLNHDARPSRRADLAIADECRLNVLWWHDVPRGARALEIEVPGLAMTSGLAALYGEVERIPVVALDDSQQTRFMPFDDGRFDLVTLYGHCPSAAALREIRRVLGADGTLLLAAGNRWWNGRWRGARAEHHGRLADRRLVHQIRGAGFDEVFPYWIEPSLALPRTFVPAVQERAAQFESIRAREWGADTARSAAVKLRLPDLVYPSLLFVARVSRPLGPGRR